MSEWGPRWSRHRQRWYTGEPHKRRFLFWRFAVIFGAIWLVFITAVVLLVSLVLSLLGIPVSGERVILVVICGVPLGFSLLALVAGGWAFRRVGYPLAEVMAAADAVADGNLDVRVRENAPGEFGRMARSFNRMTSELRRAEQQRRNLTADVAHELRTPLHIIQGNLEGVLDGIYQPSPEHITATLEETRLLSRLVSDLQTLSLAEAGELPLHFQNVSAADLLSDVATSFAAQAEAAGIELRLDLPQPAVNLQIEVDPDRIDQVLSNLVHNALHYTPAGGVIILGASEMPGGVRLTVRDSGSGISSEDLPFIFDRFWRGERSRSRQAGSGSGLGLAITRQLVRAHGGKIDVESQPGQGTTFTIELPSQR